MKFFRRDRIIYIFDEFSEFVDENSSQLKTFEDVTEAPDINHFYLVPVTHKEPVAFLGENAPGAKRARDRFYFRDLRMPNDIAFKLAGHAMKENEGMKQEWKDEKDKLWSSISTVVDRFDDPETSAAYFSRESFYNILPIHPMAAFLLKFLAEHARSNQRSIFEYLKGSADGREFQEFVAKGGPSISSAQFLTPDYLWKYFMERSDAGQSREITDIKLEYDRIVSREFRNYGDEQAEIRVLKTVMLFSLLSRLASDGHKRLLPTVENVELSFRGDGTIMDVRSILTELANEHHCFSIVDGNIDLYSSTIGGKELEDKVQDCMGKFHELLHEKCEREFEAHTKNSRAGFSGNRFDIRVSDESHTTLANISPATRDKFSQNLAKDDGSICLWFVVAKEKSDQIRIHERIDHLLTQLRDHRIVMLSFPNNTFCKDNTKLWNEYATLRAQYLLENNTTAKEQIEKSFKGIEDNWIRILKAANLFVWLVKRKIPQDSYLYQVLLDTDVSTQYWRNYVVHTALSALDNEKADVFASERADVLRGRNEPLIAEFVNETLDNDRAILFLNCESEFEIAGLIRHAARYELAYGMPDSIKKIAPVLAHYLSPGFDYGSKGLTDYFSKLRCFRMRNTIDEEFVRKAYAAEVPCEIAKRDDIIAKYNDGDTALLVVDGMGAEYYPLLLNMAKQNGIGIAEQRIVRSSLPTSTQFNSISWDKERRLKEVKRAGTISHMGYSAHEKCEYSDNLAEIFRVFRMDIILRIQAALKANKRVLVTADHGSSYLAVLAHKNKMNRTLPWNGTPDDWRYAALEREIETPEGMISEYHASDKKTYYIVKGYNRLPKEGGKEYALHGGATLEEILVPFVMFTNDTVATSDDESVDQLVENEDFDILVRRNCMYDVDKLRKNFPQTSIYKDKSISAIFRQAKIEAFLRDWIIRKKAGPDGRIADTDALSKYIAKIIPQQSEKSTLEDEARTNGETRPFLAKVNIAFNSNANYYCFELPDLGFSYSNTIIEDYVWERIKDELLRESGGWGLVKIGYMPPEENKKNGRFTLLDFKNFCPYTVNLDAYRKARANYDDTEEWMDVLLGAIDYCADGFRRPGKLDSDTWLAKHTMLTRLLPFVQPRINLIELAPQQTGKSYIFGKVGKYGWLAGGGSLSRAKLFLDMRPGAKTKGLVTFNDFVAIDEIKSISFTIDKEMAGIFKGYMEDGYVNVGGNRVDGDAGIIFLGNIDVNDMDANRDMFRELPDIFRDSALLQRIHGFVPGKYIPALSPSMYMDGWALNTEYFTEIMHQLRSPAETMRYRALVEELVAVSGSEISGREQEAVLNADKELIKTLKFKQDFDRYCLQPAKKMQLTVLQQLKIINPNEFANKQFAAYSVRYDL